MRLFLVCLSSTLHFVSIAATAGVFAIVLQNGQHGLHFVVDVVTHLCLLNGAVLQDVNNSFVLTLRAEFVLKRSLGCTIELALCSLPVNPR